MASLVIYSHNLRSPLSISSVIRSHHPSTPRFLLPHSIAVSSRTRNLGSTVRMANSSSTHQTQDIVVQQQRIVIQNDHGEKLVGVLHETGSLELVVLCHGFRSSKENNTMLNIAAALEKERISAFRFDFAGNGESEGSFQYGNYWREADDLRSVIKHFSGAKRVITAILGHSKGGNVVLLYASRYPDVHTVINVSGRFNLERGIEGRLGKDFLQRIKKDGFIDVKDKTGKAEYRVTEESLLDRLNADMAVACHLIEKECRVLTVHGSQDEIVPAEDALEFAKIIRNHKIHIIEGADHGYTSHQAELISVVLDFTRAGLQQDKDIRNQVEVANAPADN
ncbi:PREDICTED: uncharacterized protein LOC104600706 [Nelumbo nucifera]|uniref:Uncharacterized protein LOC104600706 n=1 Tax=Nelumbo nucifera TaxID=4432 RepID=A0A1U8A4M6_NELNU|nr:PREDICTED: uncharacterized protein LOC104600706 [Nelumbo nucifera]